MPTPRDLELLFEISSLRNVQRGWRQHLATDCATDLEHTVRVAFLALIIARREGTGNEETILKMALAHDVAETRTSDLSYVPKVYVKADEPTALHDIFTGTHLADFEDLVNTYERRDTIEAKIVKDADNLDVELELKELEEKGHQLPAKWRDFRKFVRDEKLYTNSAKQMWDEMQTADVASWHLNSNKWLKIPEAGR